ncbi:ribonuclease H-like domain-containing protein [Tanacetum coccineum]
MWHQRLGHPGDEVLRSLVSRNFVSCNKEKSQHVCHACQLGKHVKLPFSSSTSIVSSCFEIIHSDIWTSPIKKYAMELLKRAYMLNCNPTWTPVDTESKLGLEGTPISDPTLYQSLAGGLQYLTFTRLDLSYVVQQICLYMHDPWEPHLAAIKRIRCYVQGTLEFGLQLYASSRSSIVAYYDAD